MFFLIRTLRIQRSVIPKRCYSSNKKNGGGPSEEKVKAIPFAQHVKAAEKVNSVYYPSQ
jgi:hypothetical protein